MSELNIYVLDEKNLNSVPDGMEAIVPEALTDVLEYATRTPGVALSVFAKTVSVLPRTLEFFDLVMSRGVLLNISAPKLGSAQVEIADLLAHVQAGAAEQTDVRLTMALADQSPSDVYRFLTRETRRIIPDDGLRASAPPVERDELSFDVYLSRSSIHFDFRDSLHRAGTWDIVAAGSEKRKWLFLELFAEDFSEVANAEAVLAPNDIFRLLFVTLTNRQGRHDTSIYQDPSRFHHGLCVDITNAQTIVDTNTLTYLFTIPVAGSLANGRVAMIYYAAKAEVSLDHKRVLSLTIDSTNVQAHKKYKIVPNVTGATVNPLTFFKASVLNDLVSGLGTSLRALTLERRDINGRLTFIRDGNIVVAGDTNKMKRKVFSSLIMAFSNDPNLVYAPALSLMNEPIAMTSPATLWAGAGWTYASLRHWLYFAKKPAADKFLINYQYNELYTVEFAAGITRTNPSRVSSGIAYTKADEDFLKSGHIPSDYPRNKPLYKIGSRIRLADIKSVAELTEQMLLGRSRFDAGAVKMWDSLAIQPFASSSVRGAGGAGSASPIWDHAVLEKFIECAVVGRSNNTHERYEQIREDYIYAYTNLIKRFNKYCRGTLEEIQYSIDNYYPVNPSSWVDSIGKFRDSGVDVSLLPQLEGDLGDAFDAREFYIKFRSWAMSEIANEFQGILNFLRTRLDGNSYGTPLGASAPAFPVNFFNIVPNFTLFRIMDTQFPEVALDL